MRAGLQMLGVSLLVCLACGKFTTEAQRDTEGEARGQTNDLTLYTEKPLEEFIEEDSGWTEEQKAKVKALIAEDAPRILRDENGQPYPSIGPDEPPPFAPSQLAPAVLPQPLSIKLQAPIDTIAGNWVPMEAIVTGAPTSFAWNVIAAGSGQQGQPRTPGLLEQQEKAFFTSAVPGEYIIECAAANALGQVVLTSTVVTLLSPPPVNPLTPQSIAEITPQTDLSELHRAWVAEVPSAGRTSEAATVAESFREIAALLEAGSVEDMADPLRLVERSFELAAGPAKLQIWQSYFGRVRDLAAQLQQAGALETSGQFSTLFANLAGMLDAASGR